MHHDLEKHVVLPHVTVQLATITWQGIGASPLHSGHALFQRLSDDHSPVRIGNLTAPDVLPRAHSVGFLPAGMSIRMFPIEKPLRVLYCFYDTDFVEKTTGIAAEQWERHADSLAALRNRRLEILMQDVHAELNEPGLAHHSLIEAVMTTMLVELARHVSQMEKYGVRQECQALASWQLRRIEERIEASLEQGYPALAELAGLCGISQGHLARAFKASTGWQIHKYIAEKRIKAAKQMLVEGRLSCEEVSACLGFSSASYFSTAFRRITGQTPSELRRKALAGSGGLR